MEKKVALITGSTSGLGLGIAKAFAAKGCQLVFNGINEGAEEIAAQVAGEFGIRHLFFPANMLNPEALRDMVQKSAEAFGAIDILVNNAGIQYVESIEHFPEEKWDEIISINLTAAFHLTKAVWPHMKNRRFGRIINIASAHGLVASEFKSAYVAAKHGLVGFTKAVALEGAPYNINCNAICPGYVKTPLVEMQLKSQAAKHGISEEDVAATILLAKQAVKAFIPVEAVAGIAILLADPDSSTLTGAALPVDGGWSAQ